MKRHEIISALQGVNELRELLEAELANTSEQTQAISQWKITKEMVAHLNHFQIDELIEAINEAVQAICQDYEVGE